MTIKITRRDLLNGMVISAGGIAFNSYASGPAVGGDSPVTSGFTPPGLLPTYPPALTGMRGSHEGYYEVAHALAWEGKKPATYQSLDEHYDLISMFTKADQAAVEKQELVLVLKKN